MDQTDFDLQEKLEMEFEMFADIMQVFYCNCLLKCGKKLNTNNQFMNMFSQANDFREQNSKGLESSTMNVSKKCFQLKHDQCLKKIY